jgi:NAD(P)-dependent dehydrogenase (short-subunit alcohol dehydrogenase family)
VTGGDSRIGRAAATAYAREGADVAINYFSYGSRSSRTEG